MINLIFIIFLGGAALTWLSGKIHPILRDVVFLASVIVPSVLFFMNVEVGQSISFNLIGYKLSWGINYLGYLFSFIVLGLGILAGIYAVSAMKGKENLGFFYSNFILSIMAMLGILFSRDLVSFFIFWEIMTWSSYLMVVYQKKDVQKVGIKYFVFSAIGAYAMLMAIVTIYSLNQSMMISDLVASFASFDPLMQWLIPILLLTGFGVKSAMMPLHVWAPGAYSHSPMAYTSVFSGALSKMGVYGMVIVMVSLVPHIPDGFWLRESIAWLGAITAVIGTLWAVAQDDAKRLLAYSSVAQLGYIIVGIAVGTPLAMLAALFMAVMHGLFKGTLFMAVGAIEKQTGTSNFTEVTGLIRKMPWTFISALISVIALAGIVAIFLVSSVVFVRYRNLKISLGVILTMFSEVIIILGFAAATQWNLSTLALAGIIAAIGFGVDDQILIIDETSKKSQKYSLKEGLKRAFFMIIGAGATTIFAMLPILWAGFTAYREVGGFAVTVIVGVLIGVLISRPAFARLVELVLIE